MKLSKQDKEELATILVDQVDKWLEIKGLQSIKAKYLQKISNLSPIYINRNVYEISESETDIDNGWVFRAYVRTYSVVNKITLETLADGLVTRQDALEGKLEAGFKYLYDNYILPYTSTDNTWVHRDLDFDVYTDNFTRDLVVNAYLRGVWLDKDMKEIEIPSTLEDALKINCTKT